MLDQGLDGPRVADLTEHRRRQSCDVLISEGQDQRLDGKLFADEAERMDDLLLDGAVPVLQRLQERFAHRSQPSRVSSSQRSSAM